MPWYRVVSIMKPQTDSEFYRSILDNLYDGVYFVDRERRITFWSRGAERIAGYAAEEVVGRACADGILFHVDELGNHLCNDGCPLAATMADGEARQAAVYLHHKEGHRVAVLVRSAPLWGPDGDIEGAVETFSDNTAALAAIQRLEELNRELIEDPLTGVGNRRFLDVKLRSCHFESQITGRPFGVLPCGRDHREVVPCPRHPRRETRGDQPVEEVTHSLGQVELDSVRGDGVFEMRWHDYVAHHVAPPGS